MLLKMLLASSLIFLSSCALTVPSIEPCIDLGESAFCKNTLSGEERVLYAEEWYDRRMGGLNITAEDFGKIKIFILQACERRGGCSQEQRKQIEDFVLVMDECRGECGKIISNGR